MEILDQITLGAQCVAIITWAGTSKWHECIHVCMSVLMNELLTYYFWNLPVFNTANRHIVL